MDDDWKSIYPKSDIYLTTKNGILYNSHVLDKLKQFPNDSIDLVVTSPPYWGVRFYGDEANVVWKSNVNNQYDWTGQLGLEPTFFMYLEHLELIFKEIYRVLKPTGTCYVNIGDTYYSKTKGTGGTKSKKVKIKGKDNFQAFDPIKLNMNYKEKSLCLIPQRFAINMVNIGFILRNVIIWEKPNAMPSSIHDRYTVSHEYIYFFSKNKKYYFKQQFDQLKHPNAKGIKFGGNKQETNGYGNPTYSGNIYDANNLKGKNKRTVWSISTKGFKGQHFAPFPIDIPNICIDAGCPENGVVLDPFMGSGTTALSAIHKGVNWIGIEINEKYCDIIKDRLLEVDDIVNIILENK